MKVEIVKIWIFETSKTSAGATWFYHRLSSVESKSSKIFGGCAVSFDCCKIAFNFSTVNVSFTSFSRLLVLSSVLVYNPASLMFSACNVMFTPAIVSTIFFWPKSYSDEFNAFVVVVLFSDGDGPRTSGWTLRKWGDLERDGQKEERKRMFEN